MDKNKFDELYGTGDKPSRSYTKADIERIVAIAAEKQRKECVNYVHGMRSVAWGPSFADAMRVNAPAPSAADVLAEFEKMNGEKNAD